MVIFQKILLLILCILFSYNTYCQYYINQYKNNYVHLFEFTSKPNSYPCTPLGCVKDSLPLNKVATSFQVSVKLNNRQELKVAPHLGFTYNGHFQIFNTNQFISKKVFHDYKFEAGIKLKISKHLTS